MTDVQPAVAATDSGDHDRFAHYVRRGAEIASAVSGRPVEALCGKRWTPSRNPDRYPVCPECKAIHDGLDG